MMSCGMRACEKVIMVFITVTGWTIRTFFGVSTMNNVTNRQQAVRPFDEDVGTTRFLITQSVIELPIDVAGEGPIT